MAEKETIFSSKIKYDGILSFTDFYKFCYNWLTEETGLIVAEEKYAEKLSGESKNIDVVWAGKRKLTDYFQFEAKITFKVLALTQIEINKDGKKIKTNKGNVEVGIKGVLVRDWQGKFEKDAFRKFLRSIYEKWIIQSRVEQFEGKIVGDCDEFLSQAKAWLDLEGKR